MNKSIEIFIDKNCEIECVLVPDGCFLLIEDLTKDSNSRKRIRTYNHLGLMNTNDAMNACILNYVTYDGYHFTKISFQHELGFIVNY